MSKKKRLAILAGCMVLCSYGFPSMVQAEEAAKAGEVTEVEEVVVTAGRFKALNPVKFTVIDEEEIKAKGAQNAAEALKDVTGLFVTSNNTKGKSIAQFRGSDADNTRVFVDGVPLSPVGDGKVDLRAIPADNIEKIEIIKGAVPVMYGTDAPGGVIYITTKKAGNKMARSLSITTGTNNDEKYFLSLAGSKGKTNYIFGTKHEVTGGYTAHAEATADYFNGKLSWDLSPKSTLTFFGSYSERQEELPNRIDPATGLPVTNQGQGGSVTGRNAFWADTYDWEYDPVKNSYVGALYNYKLNPKSDLSLKIYQSKENSHLKAYGWAQQYWTNPYFDPAFKWAHMLWDGTVQGWELQHTLKTSPANTLTWGYAYETRDFTEQTSKMTYTTNLLGQPNAFFPGFNTAYYDHTGKSFFIQDTTQVNRRLSTSVGYRHYEIRDEGKLDTISFLSTEEIKKTDKADDPVFSFNYALSDTINMHGSIGTSYRSPTARERLGPGGIYGAPTSYWVGGGGIVHGTDGLGENGMGIVCKDLKPEEAINRELGVGYAVHGLKFDITFFNRDITDMIKGQGFGQQHTQYYNIPNVEMQGYEVEINKKIRNGLKAFLNYTYTDAYDPLIGQQVRDIPNHKYSFGLNYVGEDGVNANLAVNYIGSRTSAFSNGNGMGNGDNPMRLTTQDLAAYSTVDLKVGKSKDNRDYYVRILNLFDKKYYQGCYLTAPGRYIEVGTTIKF